MHNTCHGSFVHTALIGGNAASVESVRRQMGTVAAARGRSFENQAGQVTRAQFDSHLKRANALCAAAGMTGRVQATSSAKLTSLKRVHAGSKPALLVQRGHQKEQLFLAGVPTPLHPAATMAGDEVGLDVRGDKQAAPEVLVLAESGNTRARRVAAPGAGFSTRISLCAHAVAENLDAVHPSRLGHEAPLALDSVHLVASASARSGNNDDGHLQRSFLAPNLDGNCPFGLKEHELRRVTFITTPKGVSNIQSTRTAHELQPRVVRERLDRHGFNGSTASPSSTQRTPLPPTAPRGSRTPPIAFQSWLTPRC